MRHCCLSSGRNTPFITPFLIHRETVARSTFKSFATSEAFKKAFIQLQYKLSNELSRGQTVASVARDGDEDHLQYRQTIHSFLVRKRGSRKRMSYVPRFLRRDLSCCFLFNFSLLGFLLCT